MAYWEFLLQQEGDRDWLPLETAHVEISEGRYRIIAHTSYGETAVDIRLSQLLTEPFPPRYKTLKRTGQTTGAGLMVVIPFTHLIAGRWIVQCSAAAPESDWQYRVQLQVLPVESGLEYWDIEHPDDPEPETSNLPTWAELPEPEALPPSEPSLPDAAHVLSEPREIADLPLRLQLAQQALVAQGQTQLPIEGHITSPAEVDGVPTAGTLWIQLRDPETGAVRFREGRALAITALPSPFEVSLSLPTVEDVRLLVGELSLWSAGTPPQLLAIQGFTVTLNLDALLEQVADQGEKLTATIQENLAATAPNDPAPSREVPFRRLYLPTSGLTLPPVIYSSPEANGPITLPNLPNSVGKVRSSFPLESSEAATKPPSAPPSKGTVELPAFGRSPQAAPLPSEPEFPPAAPQPPAPDTTPGPDFQGRFWSRLSALAEESQKTAATLKAEMEAAGLTPSNPSDSGLSSLTSAPLETTFPHEVVVYEDESSPALQPDPIAARPQSLPELPAPPTDDDAAELPSPQLTLPAGELIAGAALPISVSLPPYPRRLAVKVWVVDVQSRSLADRLRWLMNWTVDDTGEQTALLQLQVPQGCLEARFEATAVDLTTQRESRKTTLIREILPPDLPHAETLPPL